MLHDSRWAQSGYGRRERLDLKQMSSALILISATAGSGELQAHQKT